MFPHNKKIVLVLLLVGLILIFLGIYFGLKERGRINILLLGVPGGDCPGPELTDTMMVLSINPAQKDLALVSIPRDIWIDSSGTKINALYSLGGLGLVEEEIHKILGLKVNFETVVDFEGFRKAIDLVDGLDIEVEHSFDDFEYPIPGKENDDCEGDPEYRCRYEYLHFDQGQTHMDGELALKFARSRFATNSGEGTDFARSKRQQKLVLAFKNRLFSKRLLNPEGIFGFFQVFRESVKTDFSPFDFVSVLRIFLSGINWEEPRIFALDWGKENRGGLLFNPPVEEYESWVLVPRSGDWQEVQRKLREFLELKSETK